MVARRYAEEGWGTIHLHQCTSAEIFGVRLRETIEDQTYDRVKTHKLFTILVIEFLIKTELKLINSPNFLSVSFR